MSKGSSYWSTARGKIGNTVVSINKGQRIERAYQPVVSNPKSKAQMTQRAIFAAAVKFYKHATQNFFKFAFENKKQTESDYNAFMRNNRGVGMICSRDQYLNNYYPAIGNRFMMTQGSLSEIVTTENVEELAIYLAPTSSLNADIVDMTVGQLSTLLEANYGDLADGDFFTLVRVKSSLEDIKDEPTSAPKWTIVQIALDSTSEEKVTDFGFEMANFYANEKKAKFFDTDADHFDSFAVMVSRKTEAGIKVGNSYLYLNDIAATVYNDSLQTGFREAALISWGSTGDTILGGSLVNTSSEKPVEVYYTVTLIAGNHGSVDPAGETQVKAGESLVIKATPNSGYNFKQWSDGDDNPTRTITPTGDMTLTATFENQ